MMAVTNLCRILEIITRIQPFIENGDVRVSGTVLCILMLATGKQVSPELFATLLMAMSKDFQSFAVNDLDLVLTTGDVDSCRRFVTALCGSDATNCRLGIKFFSSDGRVIDTHGRDPEFGRLGKEAGPAVEAFTLLSGVKPVHDSKLFCSSHFALLKLKVLDICVDIRFDKKPGNRVKYANMLYDPVSFNPATMPTDAVPAKKAVWLVKSSFVYWYKIKARAINPPYDEQKMIGHALCMCRSYLTSVPDVRVVKKHIAAFVHEYNRVLKSLSLLQSHQCAYLTAVQAMITGPHKI